MTDTTDIKVLRDQPDNGPYALVMAQNEALTKGIVVLQSQLEAERQRADKANRTCSDLLRTATDEAMRANKAEAELAALKGEQVPVALTVWYGSMPESNGKENWTAILHRKGEGKLDGITIDRSEYPGRVLYAADRARYLIGEKEDRPHVLSYDGDKRSDYVYPITAQQKPVVLPAKKQWTSFYHEGDPNHCPAHYLNEGYLLGIFEMKQAIEAAGGIVKDGE